MLDMVEDGVSGLLVPPGDAVALGRALCRLLDDPTLAERLGRGGASRVADFRASAVVARVEAVYRSVAERVCVG
jgi:glycosyltransferase involved in cell wall biosynthesis